VCHGAVRRRVGRSRTSWNLLTRIGIESSIAETRRIIEAGVKRQAEEATLIGWIGWRKGWCDQVLDVERGSRQQGAVLNHAQQAVLLDDEQAIRIAGRANAVIRRRQAGCNWRELD